MKDGLRSRRGISTARDGDWRVSIVHLNGFLHVFGHAFYGPNIIIELWMTLLTRIRRLRPNKQGY